MANNAGKTTAITVITPMKPWKTFFFRIFLFVRRLGLFAGPSLRLKKLAFIHFARWVIIDRRQFPRFGEQQGENLRYDYMLFCSNFNGSWDQYIDAFSDIVPDGMNTMWWASEQFPGARPITKFKTYIQHNEIDTDYYYSAYPGAAAKDVQSALELNAKLQAFAATSRDLTPAEFQRAYTGFLVSVQGLLGATGIRS